MSIEGRDNQIHQSPRGGKRGSGKVGKWEREKGRKKGEGERERGGKTGLLFAPAERNVYRRAIGPRTALQRSAMWGLSESGYQD